MLTTAAPAAYEGHPLDLSCPTCRANGTAWFSPDAAAGLRIDEVPAGFQLIDQAEAAVGPQFSCVVCQTTATNL